MTYPIANFRITRGLRLLVLAMVLTILLFSTITVLAVNHVATFDPKPFTETAVTTVDSGTADTGLTVEFTTEGDGGDFAYTTNGGDGGTGALDALSSQYVIPGTTEVVSITSRDGKAFVFNSVYLDVYGDGITIEGVGPEPFSVFVAR